MATLNPNFGNRQKAYDTIIGITPPNKLGWEKQKDGSLTPVVWKAPMQDSEQKALGIPCPKWGQELQGMARTIYSLVPKKLQKQIIDSEACAKIFVAWANAEKSHGHSSSTFDIAKKLQAQFKDTRETADGQRNKRIFKIYGDYIQQETREAEEITAFDRFF